MVKVFDQGAPTLENSTERPRSKPLTRTGGFWVAVLSGLASLTVVSGYSGYTSGQNSRNQDVARAEALGTRNTDVALALGRAGFTNVIDVESSVRGTAKATLSLDPNNPRACHVAFYVAPDNSLVLNQSDADGRGLAQIIVRSTAEATQIMNDRLCRPRA